MAPPTGAASLVLGKAKHSKLFPLVAIKCMRAHGPSGNLLFAGAKTGQAERDFFAHGLCTQLTRKVPTAAQPALRAFEKYSKYPLALGLSEFASLDEDGCDLSGGCEELGATFPWALHLHPRVASPPLPDGAPNTAFVDALLATVAPETVLYDVYAAASPDAVSGKDARVERIGRVVATSVAIPSPAGSPIVFRHQAKEDDYALRPESGTVSPNNPLRALTVASSPLQRDRNRAHNPSPESPIFLQVGGRLEKKGRRARRRAGNGWEERR